MITRATVVQAFLDLFENPHYLEIGVNRGTTFHSLKAGRKVAVDPCFLFDEAERENSESVEYHEVTSDEYFSSKHNGLIFDVIFIDGLHTFDQTLRDLLNSVMLLKDRGVIIVDDVIPSSYDASLRDFPQITKLREQTRNLGVLWETDGSWMGDVYKIPFFVDHFMQQMSFATVTENHGQTILWHQTRNSHELPKADFDSISRLDFRDTILRRPSYRLHSLRDIVADVGRTYGLSNPSPVADEGPRSIFLPACALDSTVQVPGEQLPHPEVSFPELMPASVRAVQMKAWGSFRESKPIEIHRLQNVYVVGEGLVFDERGSVYAATTAKFADKDLLEGFHALETQRGQASVPRYYGPHLLCGQAGLSNYGHWLVEILPGAFITRDRILQEDWRVFVPKIYPWMQAVVRDSLELLQIDSSRCEEGDGEVAWFEELIIVSGMTEHGEFYLPVTAECLQTLAEDIQSDGSEKVWISRLGERRSLKCEAEVNDRLSSGGWRVMLPRELSLQQQIAACKGARMVAGVNGAGLTNMAFMSSGGRVTSFVPAHMPDLFFWALAANGKLSFHDVRCPTLHPDETSIAWDVQLDLTADEVLRLID